MYYIQYIEVTEVTPDSEGIYRLLKDFSRGQKESGSLQEMYNSNNPVSFVELGSYATKLELWLHFCSKHNSWWNECRLTTNTFAQNFLEP